MKTILSVLVFLGATLAHASIAAPRFVLPVVTLERNVTHLAAYNGVRATQFASQTSTDCENTTDPEPLITPDPMDVSADTILSIIIGVDGHVYSPFILEGGDSRAVLNAVSHWRYRPATCNGVPVDSEGKVVFLVR